MDELMTKAILLETLRTRRAEWDAVLAEVPVAQMAEPGVTGEWSVKDVIAHLTYYERWFADRLEEQLRGESYVPTELDFMGEARNDVVFQQHRDQPLAEVLADSRATFQRLVAGIEVHSEAFLLEPQQFEGAPGPVRIWQMLRGDVYDHYPQHVPAIRQWLAARAGS
jgi:uncharacterized protein (TIGR03083 family)